MTALRREEPVWMYAAIAVLGASVFAIDLLTQQGKAVWILFIPAVVLCTLLSWRPLAPVGVAAGLSALIITSHLLEPIPTAEIRLIVLLNRGMGVATLLLLGLMGRLFVLHRTRLGNQEWLEAGQSGLAQRLQGNLEVASLGRTALAYLAEYLGAPVGALFTADEDGRYAWCAGYARSGELAHQGRGFAPGEGLVGQVAAGGSLVALHDLPGDYVQVRSGLGGASPRSLVLVPTRADGQVNGVLELGFFAPPPELVRELLGAVAEWLGMALQAARYRARQAALLEESQRQQEELQSANAELEEQTQRIKSSQEELEETNAQLEAQKDSLLGAQRLLQQRTTEIERASRYKSEFLANMSHELRTPLNSSLILAKLLADNRDANLSPEQVKFAQSIYAAGNDLLGLINDILDLSKIEAGRVELSLEPVSLPRLFEALRRRFEPLAAERRLELRFSFEAGCPETLHTDPLRLQQVLSNLLSNSVKFTEQGWIHLRAASEGPRHLALSVEDTGIGIPPEQHEVVFEAFRQADGTTNRKYGGTGLGLSICRELVTLLGGTVRLRSASGEGSTFTVALPIEAAAAPRRGPLPRVDAPPPPPSAPGDRAAPRAAFIADDREGLVDPRRVLLIIEDDPPFAEILRDLGREQHFQCVVARDASEGLALARRYRPVAAVLDLGLPDQSGLTVLEQLKRDPATRHVPIHVVSVHDHQRVAQELGAVGYLLKPVGREVLTQAFEKLEQRLARKVKSVLVVEDDAVQREAICRLLESSSVEVVAVAGAEEGLEKLRAAIVDCCVVDLMLPGVSGLELLDRMAQDDRTAFPPVIIYTARPLSPDEEQRLRRLSASIIIKGARSPERLLEEVTLFLHQVEAELPPERQRMLQAARDRERIFDGRRVLLVEDDVRNVFALSRSLELRGLAVEIARNGKEALARLAEAQPIDLVLMDVMMPELDGLTATRALRADPRHKALPIIALTAKAMPDDRAACLEAGANDYIAKPVNVEKLLSLLRVWMPR